MIAVPSGCNASRDRYTPDHKNSILFLQPIDFSNGADLKSIVRIADKAVDVYPTGYENKPQPGRGFNVPARVTLRDVYPVNKTTRQVRATCSTIFVPSSLQASVYLLRRFLHVPVSIYLYLHAKALSGS